MTKQEFKRAFETVLEEAARSAEKDLTRSVPRNFRIRLYAPGHPRGDIVDVDTAADELYLEKDRFYRIIDIAIVEVSRQDAVVFVRVSGHTPGSWEETWNTPPGSGPFKVLIANVKLHD